MLVVDKPRLAEVMGGITMMLAGVAFAVFFLLVPLVSTDSATVTPHPLSWLAVTVFLIAFIEASLVVLRRSLAMRGSQLKAGNTSAWTLIGQFFQYQDMLVSGLASVFFLAMVGGTSYLLVRWAAANQLQTAPPFFMQLSVYAVYLFVRIPLMNALRPLGAAIGKQFREGLPSYQLTPDGVDVDLGITHIGKPLKRYVVNIGFAELNEVQAFSFAEAEAFESYQIGPNVGLLARQTKDLYQYLRGAIPRPTVYGLNMLSTSGTTILLRGPELFYFITFNTLNGNDLVTAYKTFRQHRAGGANPQ